MDNMRKKLIEKLYEFYENFALRVYIDKKIEKENYSILYSEVLKDAECNFAFKIKADNEKEFIRIFENIKKDMQIIKRLPVFVISPLQEFLYENKEKLFSNNFNNISKEVWQIYRDFEKIEKLETNCKLDIKLEKAISYEEFAREMLESYKGDEEDPYYNLENGYLDIDYNWTDEKTISEFYFIKNSDKVIGTVANVYNKEIFGIHGLAIKRAYRKLGIGKEVLKRQLKIAKEKSKIAFLQTEEGFYPAELYRKIGFEDICTLYYYKEKI